MCLCSEWCGGCSTNTRDTGTQYHFITNCAGSGHSLGHVCVYVVSGMVVAVPIPETQASNVIPLQTVHDQAIREVMYVFM